MSAAIGPAADMDGVPPRWAALMNGKVNKVALKKEDIAELNKVVDMLCSKNKYQKAADLWYYAALMPDSNNEELRGRWNELCKKTNLFRAEVVQKRRKEEENEALQLGKAFGKAQPISDTRLWKNLKEQGKLPADDPNWHLGKLKPWMGPQAMARGNDIKAKAASLQDPFKKVFELEEACKMYNRVLEIEPKNEEARHALNQCVSQMNGEYVRMKGIKNHIKAANFEATKVGDFLSSRNAWVKETRTGQAAPPAKVSQSTLRGPII